MYGTNVMAYMPGNLDNYGVAGLDAVKSFSTQPNQRYVLFDTNEDLMYFFTTDGSNTKSAIRRCKFEDFPIPKAEDLFVSKSEFSEMKEEISDVKQSIQQLVEHITDTWSNTAPLPSVVSSYDESGDIAGKHGSDKGRAKPS